MAEPDFLLQAQLSNEAVLRALDEIDKHADQMAESSNESFQDMARKIEASMLALRAKVEAGALEDTDLGELLGIESPEKFRSQVERVLRDVRNLAKLPPEITAAGQATLTDSLGLEQAQAQFEVLRQAAKTFLESGNEQAQRFGRILAENLRDSVPLLQGGEEGARKFAESMKLLTTEANRMNSTLNKLGAEENQLDRKLNINMALVHMRQLDESTKRLLESNDPLARRLGQTLRDMGTQATVAFQKGQIQSEEFNKRIRQNRAEAERLEREFETLPQTTQTATVSMYQLGVAVDRLGVRGAQSIFALVNSMRGIPIQAFAAVAAVALIGAGLVRAAKAGVQFAKTMTKTFVEITKGAVLVSEELELIDRQLTNIFQGKEELAEHTLRRILELSTEFGVDLTGDISRVFLPLVESFEQFEQVAQLASTLVIGFNRTDEEVARALKQAAAGHFRPLHEQFGLLQADIDIVKQLQDEYGALQGVILGLNEFLERSGQEWDTYEGTLRRVRGSLEQWRKLVESIFGEPVRIAIAEQLDSFLDQVEENRDAIVVALNSIGEAVGQAVGDVGETFNNILGDVDPEDLEQLLQTIDAIFLELGQVPENILTTAFPDTDKASVLSTLDAILTVIEEITFQVNNWIEGQRVLRDLVQDAIPLQEGVQDAVFEGVLRGIATNIFGPFNVAVSDLGRVSREESGSLDELRQRLDEAQAARREYIDAVLDGTDAVDESIDAGLAENARLQELRELASKAAEAEKELAEARKELALEASRDLQDIEIELGRRRIDIAIDVAEKRADAERELQLEIRDIHQKHRDRVLQQLVESGDDSLDNFIKYSRALEDLQLESSREREDNEKKHQERLKDIRARFAFDAQEALRQNDAVVFLRILRRMEFELAQEEEKQERIREEEVEAERRKQEDLEREYRRGEEDISRSHDRKLRDLQTRLDIELREEREKHKETLADIDIWEQRQQDALKEWQKRKLADHELWLERQKEDMDRKYADQLKIIEKYNNAQIDMAEDAAKEIQGIWGEVISWITSQWGAAVPNPPGGLGTFPSTGGGTSGRFGDNGGGKGGGSDRGAGGGVGQSGYSLEELRTIARRVIQDSTIVPDSQKAGYISNIPRMTRGQLIQLINQLDRNALRGPSRHSGGYATPGVTYNTRPGEGFNPVTAGIVNPTGPMSIPNMASVTPGVTYDYSRPVTADVSLLDPTHLSPTQITMIRNLITEEILNYATQR